MMIHNVKDYGASGDGETKDTHAIQKALDQCAADGGGRVYFPTGHYLTGTLFIRDDTEINIDRGTVVKASPDLADYNSDDCIEQNATFQRERATGAHLIIAHEAKNISIIGHGIIDGNSSAFIDFSKEGTGRDNMIKTKRPGQMIYLVECVNVRLDGLTLRNSPYWTCFLHGCEDVWVRGLNISSRDGTPEGDGLDIDSCKNVTVSDCHFRTSDDSLTLRGNISKLKTKNRKCENVLVTNCILSSRKCGIRIGVGNGHVRNCAVTNCVINNSRTGAHLVSKYNEQPPGKGTTIDNVNFFNITMNDVYIPIWIVPGKGARAEISDIRFRHINVSAESGCFISGHSQSPVRNLTLKDVSMTIKKSKRKTYEAETPYSSDLREWDLKGAILPHLFYVTEVDNAQFSNIDVKRENTPANSTSNFLLRNVTNSEFSKCHLD